MRLVDVYRHGKVAPGAIEFLYELLKERPAEANISHSELPPIEKHRQFVMRRPYRSWFLIENEEGERVGALYLTERNEIGIAIAKQHHRKGYAREAIAYVLANIPPLEAVPSVRRGRYIANVAPGNEASRYLFERMGGKLIQVTYEL